MTLSGSPAGRGGRRRVYLDWNATTPLCAPAAEAMRAVIDRLACEGLNPSSQHGEGRAARGMIEAARRSVAALIGAEPSEIVFTGSASEAATTVMAQGWDQILLSTIEHDCVLGAARASGAEINELAPEPSGVLAPETVARALAAASAATPSARRLVAVMAANNETGALQPVAEICRIARDHGATALVDMAQAAAKTPASFAEIGADLALLSAHKIQGPTGVGALVIREGSEIARRFQPLIAGGGQEMRRRAGTENLLGVVGFGAAAAFAAAPERRAEWAAAAARRDELIVRLKNAAPGLVFFADRVNRLPTTICVARPGMRAETQLMRLDLAGFSVSAGSACSSGKMAASHVLRAMGADEDLAASAIRISFGPETPEADLDAFAEAFGAIAAPAG